MQHLLDAFGQYAPIGDAARADLARMLVREELPKGTVLLADGQVCNRLYWLEKGMARGYYLRDGKDITSGFAFEGEMVLAMHSFFTRKPTVKSLELIEDSILYSIGHEDLTFLYKKYPEINTIGRFLYEKYCVALEERSFALQFLPAKERYEHLVARHPQVLQRARLGHIASLLGISPETLSRIRGKR